ncbi:MAG: hypothetical protein HQ579_03620 [Candidatus Omnitrophica bacterium]|nr:hypothetical protein [Candidatus Omnitrophota bacterium]
MKRILIYATIFFLLLGVIVVIFKKDKKDYCLTGAFLADRPNRIDITDFKRNYGKNPFFVMIFIDWSNFVDKQILEDVYSSKCVLIITWEPWRADSKEGIDFERIIDGSYDDYIASFARSLKTISGPIFLRFAHEMNGDWYPWSGITIGSDKYIKAFRHIKSLFDKVGATNVKWIFSVNWQNVPLEGNDYEDYYPGDKYVDYVGIDGYNWGDTKSWSRWLSFSDIFSSIYKRINRKFNKPILITEFSSASSGGNKALWIKDAISSIKTMKKIKGFVVFNVDKETDWSFPPESDWGKELEKQLKSPYFKDKNSI